VAGDLDSKTGLHMEQLQVNAEGAQLSMQVRDQELGASGRGCLRRLSRIPSARQASHASANPLQGTLLGAHQDATVKLDDFPLDLLEPLVEAALPNLHAPKAPGSLSHLGPVTRPIYAVQRRLRRAAEALPFQSPPAAVDAAPTSPITGKLFLSGNIAGPVDAPRVTVGVRLENAALGRVPLSEAHASATLGGDGRAKITSKLTPAGASGSVVVTSAFQVPSLEALDASVEVRDAGMALLSELAGDAAAWMEGKAALSLRVTGSVAEPRVSGKAQVRLGRGACGVVCARERLRVIPRR